MSSTAVATTDVPVTPIGVDVGVKKLVTAVSADGDLDDAIVRDGEAVQRELERLADSTQALWYAPGDSAAAEVQMLAARWHRIRCILFDVAGDVVDYARQYAAPVLVLEDLDQDPKPLWQHRTADKPGNWLMPTVQATLIMRAREAAIPTTHVDPAFTSQECHRCGEIGNLGSERLECLNEDCSLGEVCRDRSAAVSIANRYRIQES